jgi:hypothetical protein
MILQKGGLMGAVYTAFTAGLLCIITQLSAVPQRSFTISGMLLLLIPAIAFVYVLLTFYRFCGAAR